MHNSSALFSFVLSILFIVVVAIVVAFSILARFVKIFHYKSFVLPLPFAVFVYVFDCISVSVSVLFLFCFNCSCLCKFNGMQCHYCIVLYRHF